MKKPLILANIVAAVALLSALSGCTTTTTSSAAPQKETLLTQCGFRAKTVTTPKQKQRVEQLPAGVVSAVKYQGNLYYVYPTEKKDHILVGKQPQFDSYKKMLAAQQTTTQQSNAHAARLDEIRKEAQQDMYSPTLTRETAGPNRILVQEYDGFGPMWP